MDSTGTLGTGNNEAVIYERGGTRRLFTVPAVTQLDWNRALDGISRSNLLITPSSVSSIPWSDCCGLLGTVHPWAHEVVIYRDDERVWEGPVRRVAQNRKGLVVAASDVLGWTERRVTPGRSVVGADVLDETQVALAAAYAPGDPNVLDYVTALDSGGPVTTLDIKPGSGYHAATLATLVNAGLSYTVVGRRILIWADPTTVIGRTHVLNPTLHLAGDIETAREGDELATKAWMVNDDGEIGTAGGDDAFYGQVERVNSASGIAGTAALSDAADRWRSLRYPAPESLSLPDGASLDCDSPFPISVLVPGVLTQVQVSDLCWPVEQTMMLTGVKVTQSSGGEKVGVSYAPISGDEEP